MNSLYDFIIQPIGERYNNTKKIGDVDLILNNKIESWKFVNRLAKVLSTPLAVKTPIKKGDIVIVHQNIFRRFYDMQGKQKDSRSYFKDNMYFATDDQIYMYHKNNKWHANGDYCFVKPVLEKQNIRGDKLKTLRGILKYGNSSLEAIQINPEDYVGFKPLSEFEFVIDKQLLYCMKSNDIVIKYERQGHETEYNPSWTESS